MAQAGASRTLFYKLIFTVHLGGEWVKESSDQLRIDITHMPWYYKIYGVGLGRSELLDTKYSEKWLVHGHQHIRSDGSQVGNFTPREIKARG